jgi:FAD:protein FMN transferase
MRRCQALLGTFVEISTDQDDSQAINEAFSAVKQVQDLMSFHDPSSELNVINQTVHLEPVAIHSWTAEVLKIAQEIYEQSNGLFNCGIGHRLVAAGSLPCHMDLSIYQMSGIEDIRFIDPQIIISSKPLCLDLGGIAKGFAVDKAVEILQSNGVKSGCVNAGGDLRVFGSIPRSVHIRNPSQPVELINIGSLLNGAIATSSLYFSKRDQLQSHIINPLAHDASEVHLHFSDSYSILAKECVYADALTKVFALSGEMNHLCLKHFGAKAIRLTV